MSISQAKNRLVAAVAASVRVGGGGGFIGWRVGGCMADGGAGRRDVVKCTCCGQFLTFKYWIYATKFN